ncbi:MAG: hypothetical protein ACLTGY_05785 [Blautia faecis]
MQIAGMIFKTGSKVFFKHAVEL